MDDDVKFAELMSHSADDDKRRLARAVLRLNDRLPKPTPMNCRGCGQEVSSWMPANFRCPKCGGQEFFGTVTATSVPWTGVANPYGPSPF
jgi:predicted Zn-ribbon and HTH transcriptional regulator